MFSSLDDDGPDESDPVVVSTSTDRLLLFADSDESSACAYVSDVPGQILYQGGPCLADYWGGTARPEYALTLRNFWKKVPGTYTRVYPGDEFSQKYTVSHGISTTDSQSLSAEFGVEAEGLSAKVSATFEHSVTITDETSEEKTFTVAAPSEGFVRAWALYQLMAEIVGLDQNGNIISTTVGRGDVTWETFFENPTNGAFLNYFGTPDNRAPDRPTVRQVIPSGNFTPTQKDFTG